MHRRVREVIEPTGVVEIEVREQDVTHVAWVEGPDHAPTLKVAPVDVAEVLEATLWTQPTVVLTSATIPTGLGERLGLAADQFDELDVGSPFDYEEHALLYCAAHLPDPRNPGYVEALTADLGDLIDGGLERIGVAARRLAVAADLAHEL